MSNLNVKLLLNLKDRVSAPVSRMAGRVKKSMAGIRRAALRVGKTFVGVGKKATEFGKGMSLRVSAPLIGLGVLAVKTSAKFEDYSLSLETATGSTEKATEAWSKLIKFTSTTPFQLEETISAFIKLKNLGLDPSEAAMNSYGNTASAMGKSLDQFIEAVADASTFEFERLKEFGIKARQSGDRVAFTFQGQTKIVRKNAEAIEGYLRAIGDENFAGSMEKKMRGLNGILSNFQDVATNILAKFGDDITETLDLKKIIKDAADTLQFLLDKFKSLPLPMQEMIIKGFLILSVIGPMIIAFGQLILATYLAGLGFVKMAAIIGAVVGFLATPFGLIVAAIALIAGAGYLIVTNWEKVKVFWNMLWDGMRQTVSDAVDYVKPLIEWMANALSGVIDRINSAKAFITDNALTRGVSDLLSGSTSEFGGSTPIVAANQNINTGGVLNIKIDSEGRSTVTQNRPEDSRMKFNIDRGSIMGGAR